MKLGCIIIEDEPKAMSLIKEYVEQVDFLDLRFSSSDPIDALNYANNHGSDLIFLDINLPTLSGLELAGLLKEGIQIIFTTAYSKYAVQSYEHDATDYLLKPITFARFLEAVHKAKNKKLTDRKSEFKDDVLCDSFLVKSGKKIVQLQWSNVFYLEGMKEYVTLVSTTTKTMVYKRMREFESITPSDFERIHNSFIVNINLIQRIEDNHVYILDKAIPIGRKYRDAFFMKLNDRII